MAFFRALLLMCLFAIIGSSWAVAQSSDAAAGDANRQAVADDKTPEPANEKADGEKAANEKADATADADDEAVADAKADDAKAVAATDEEIAEYDALMAEEFAEAVAGVIGDVEIQMVQDIEFAVEDANVVEFLAANPEPSPSKLEDEPVAAEKPIAAGEMSVISLINGNTIQGQLRSSDSADVITWQGEQFTEPLSVLSDAVKSIKFPATKERLTQQGQFAFETVGGDLLSGTLTAWSGDQIEIDTSLFGKVTMKADSLRRMYRIEQNPTLVFASLSGLHDWNSSDWETEGWLEDGAHVYTEKPDVSLNADLGVPDKAIIEFQISWVTTPNFAFAVAVDPEAKKDERTDGWRFESIENTLAVVREFDGIADIAMVASIKDRKNIRLLAYLDQTAGQMHVYFPDGTLLAKIAPPYEFLNEADKKRASKLLGGIRVINRGKDLRLERLRISRWSGKLPTKGAGGTVNISLGDGTIAAGDSVSLRADKNELVVTAQGEESAVSLDDVVSMKLDRDPSELAFRSSLFLHDGARVSGKVNSISDTHWNVTSDEFVSPISVPRDMARTFIVMERELIPTPSKKIGRSGRLELGSHKLTGRLVPAVEQEAAGVSSFRWQPFGCLNSSPLKLDAAGRIVYRDTPKVTATQVRRTTQQAVRLQQLRLQQQKRGLNFGELFLRKTDSRPVSKQVGPDAHRLHVRSGDIIPCAIDSINEEGVRISTAVADDAFIPHHKVKAIELVANASPPDLKDAKKKRLLTLPRLQKNSPPTHLLCAKTGDFLRCRLMEVNDQFVRVEVQLDVMEIPRDRIAQIIWFHPEEILAKESGDEEVAVESPFAGLAQVLRRDGKRVTFDPQQVDDGSISGNSDVLGPCRFEIGDVDQILFGEGIREAVSVLPYNQWELASAIEPLMAQDLPEGAAEVGSQSAMIGQDAPEIKLDMLDGSRFVLSQCKGQIVVLDFWATWCAPCMQTMPLVEKVMEDYDPNQVKLVSVNLEEGADHVKAVMERHGMDVPVALDIDGVAALRYEAKAIPQMVIVDQEGKVSRLYVGGGAKTVEQMKAAIDQLLDNS